MEIVQKFTVAKYDIVFTADELEEIGRIIKSYMYPLPEKTQRFSDLIDNL